MNMRPWWYWSLRSWSLCWWLLWGVAKSCSQIRFDEFFFGAWLTRESDFTYTTMSCHDWSCHESLFKRILQPNTIWWLFFGGVLRLTREGDFTYTVISCHDLSCHEGLFYLPVRLFVYRSGFSNDFQSFLPVRLFIFRSAFEDFQYLSFTGQASQRFYLSVRLFIYRSGFSKDFQTFYWPVRLLNEFSICLFTGQAFQRFLFAGHAFIKVFKLWYVFLHFRGGDFRYTTMLLQSISYWFQHTHTQALNN